MIAFVCSSPVQVMRAINMKMRLEWCREAADVYITKNCAGVEKLYNNLGKEAVFENVYSLDVESLGGHIVFKLLYGYNKFHNFLKTKKYSKLIAFNIEGELTQALFNLNKNNDGFEYHCVEDCANIYPIYEPPKYTFIHPFKWIGVDRQAFHITTWWSSCPEYIEIPQSFKTNIRKLEPIDVHDTEYVDVVNRVFDYKDSPELDTTDILIMEEAFYQDGIMIDKADSNLFIEIKERYPKYNVLVKMHPRTKENRYEGKIRIMGKAEFPWELYLLNRVAKNKKEIIQVGIACGTLVSDMFMLGLEGKKIVLAPLFVDKLRVPQNGTPLLSEKKISDYEKIKSEYKKPENFIIAYDKQGVFCALDEMLRKV